MLSLGVKLGRLLENESQVATATIMSSSVTAEPSFETATAIFMMYATACSETGRPAYSSMKFCS